MPKPKPREFISEMAEQQEWSGRARCPNFNPALWDTKLVNKQTAITNEVERAREICLGCPVMMNCLTHAVVYGITTNIWGGCTPEERIAWARQEDMVA